MRRIFATTISLCFLTVLLACEGISFAPGQTVKPVYEDADYGLAYVGDYENLKALIGQTDNHFLKGRFLPSIMFDGADMAVDSTMEPNESAPAHSETNVQVAGVDEGDLVKTDGTYIYTLSGDVLYVVEVLGDGAMGLVFETRLDENLYGHYSELYITDDVLVAVGHHYGVLQMSREGDIDRIEVAPWGGLYFGQSMTFVHVYEIGSFELRDEYEFSGYLMASRHIDDHLYLISRHNMYFYDDIDPRPVTVVNGDTRVPEYADIKYVPGMRHETLTIISHIDLGKPDSLETDIFLSMYGWSTIYVSHRGIYMAAQSYEWSSRGVYTPKGWVVSYVFDEDGRVQYGGVGTYQGRLLNQFSMDEYEGHLRMVTTEGWGEGVVNRLYVFAHVEVDGKRTLDVIGLIDEGLGKPRETVRSVRFNGPWATVVTYELIDPFYVIDLSDPEKPTIEGELEITGFSTYQHPWTDTLVLGIGYEADGITTLGIKLALYDIDDPTNPVEAGKPLVLLNSEHGWQYGEALHNHRAILIAKEYDFLGFSIYRGYMFSGGAMRVNDYIVFGVDPTQERPISILTRISHYSVYAQNPEWFDTDTTHHGRNNDFNIRRALFIGGVLYCVSGEAITAHDIANDFVKTHTLVFSKPSE